LNSYLFISNKRPSSGVDFKELLRKAAEKKRAELREERLKNEQVMILSYEIRNE
jgi:hypothetical protein